MRRNADPSLYSGNQRVYGVLRKTAIALSLTALAASGCSGTDSNAPQSSVEKSATTTTVPTPSSQTIERGKQPLSEQLQARLSLLAAAIDKTTHVNDPRFRAYTTASSPDQIRQQPSQPKAITVVEITAKSLVSDDSGMYSLIMGGDLDADGKNVDPATATFVAVGMDLSDRIGMGKSGGFYAYQLSKRPDSGEWTIHTSLKHEDGTYEEGDYFTSSNNVPLTAAPGLILQPLTAERAEQLQSQAEVVLNRAVAALPITYAPQN